MSYICSMGMIKIDSTTLPLIILPVVIIASVEILVYMGYREPKVDIDSNNFKMKGLFGINLLFTEIAETDTIAWVAMPTISKRTNGISLNKVHRGKFRTTDGKNIHLSVQSGVTPVIKIVELNGSVYYINRKNAEETRQIFNKIMNKN